MKVLREGIRIPAAVVRVAAGTAAVAMVAAVAANASDVWRYLKIKTM